MIGETGKGLMRDWERVREKQVLGVRACIRDGDLMRERQEEDALDMGRVWRHIKHDYV